MTDSTQQLPTHKSSSRPAYLPLLLAGLFMVIGITFLVYLGREESRLRGLAFADVDAHPLLYTDRSLSEEDLAGKVAVLHFWGYWCPPCVAEYPGFASLQSEYSGVDDVLFVSIASDYESPEDRDTLRERTEEFIKENSIPELPIYCDPAEFTRTRLSRLFRSGGFSYPTTLVIGRNREIVDVWRGAITPATLKKSIESARGR